MQEKNLSNISQEYLRIWIFMLHPYPQWRNAIQSWIRRILFAVVFYLFLLVEIN